MSIQNRKHRPLIVLEDISKNVSLKFDAKIVDMTYADINMRAKIISGLFGAHMLLPQSYKATKAAGSITHIYATEKNRKKFLLSRKRLNIPSVKNKGKITSMEKIYMYAAAVISQSGASFLSFPIN